mmetsp:Transcript_7638/g.23824  ORF Transcript_7638/g.23824 Transcript_7638/m.23824 type:complete len:539 (-) Transcript_7638:48-1664(-)
MSASFMQQPELLAPCFGGRFAEIYEATRQARELRSEADALLMSSASPTTASEAGAAAADDASTVSYAETVQTYLSVIAAAADMSAHYRDECQAVRRSIAGRADRLRLTEEERSARQRLEEAAKFELQGPTEFHEAFMSRHRLAALQAAEVDERRAVLLDYSGFYQYCSDNEPAWRLGAAHAQQRRELLERAERAIRREAEDDMGLREALHMSWQDEMQDIARRHPPRPRVPSPAALAASTGAAAATGGGLYDGYGAQSRAGPSAGTSGYPQAHSGASSSAPYSTAGPSNVYTDPTYGAYPSSAAASPSQPYGGSSSMTPSPAPHTEEPPRRAEMAHRALRDDDLRLLERPPFRADVVEAVDASHNHLRALDCLPVMRRLAKLDISHNNFADSGAVIRDLKAKAPAIQELRLSPNPCAPANLAPDMHANYRAYVVANLPRLTSLDGLRVSDADRERGRRMFPNGQSGAASHQAPPPPQPAPSAAYPANSYSQHAAYGGYSSAGYGRGATGAYGSRGAYGSSTRGGGGVYGSGYGSHYGR